MVMDNHDYYFVLRQAIARLPNVKVLAKYEAAKFNVVLPDITILYEERPDCGRRKLEITTAYL